MCVAVTVGMVVKKVLEVLASNEKGRKFLLYFLGITLFIVLLPLIVLVGLFGWMSNGENLPSNSEIIQQIQAQYAERYQTNLPASSLNTAIAIDKIGATFGAYGLADKVSLAQMIYISSYLQVSNTDDTFYTKYADCFLSVNAEKSLTDNLTEAFGVLFSEEDKLKINGG